MSNCARNLEPFYKETPKSWEDICSDMQTLSEQTFELAKQKLGDEGINRLTQKSNKFLDSIREHIEGPISKYAAYHILVLGGSCTQKFPYLDFPGEYSLFKFYKKCQLELLQKNAEELLALISSTLFKALIIKKQSSN